MWFFGKKKKRLEEQRRQEELERQAKLDAAKAELEKQQIAEKIKAETVEEHVETKAKAPQKPQPKSTTEKAKAPAKKAESKPKETKTDDTRKAPSGKYEIYPEAGLFKYRLKASNGEILAVSFGYASKSGAKSGISTFVKAVENGNFEISTDKAGYSHYDLFDARGARVILIGEFYKTEKLAESAVESVKNFYTTDKIVTLDKIPTAEIREEIVPTQKVDHNPNGKFELVKAGAKSYFIRLVASNGQVLLVSQSYASKQSALNGYEAIKGAIESQNFTVAKDKQGRYQYNLYTANKQLIVSGETYPVKQHCLSSIQSVLRFAKEAKFQEINENA